MTKALIALLLWVGISGATPTLIQDTVLLPNGSPAANVQFVISWPAFVEGGVYYPAGQLKPVTNSAGQLFVLLEPNLTGQTYTVSVTLGTVTETEYWSVPASSSPQTVAAVRTTPGGGVSGFPNITLSEILQSGASIGQTPVWTSTGWVAQTTGGNLSIQANGSTIGTRPILNLIGGSGVVISGVDTGSAINATVTVSSTTKSQTTATASVISMSPGGVSIFGNQFVYTTTGTITLNSGTDSGLFYTGYDVNGQRACWYGTGVNIANYLVVNFAGSTCQPLPSLNGLWISAHIPVSTGIFGTVTDLRTDAVSIPSIACTTNLQCSGISVAVNPASALTWTGAVDFTGASLTKPAQLGTVAARPAAATAGAGALYLESDGASSCDAATGGGSIPVLVESNGTAWSAPNCGGGGSSYDPLDMTKETWQIPWKEYQGGTLAPPSEIFVLPINSSLTVGESSPVADGPGGMNFTTSAFFARPDGAWVLKKGTGANDSNAYYGPVLTPATFRPVTLKTVMTFDANVLDIKYQFGLFGQGSINTTTGDADFVGIRFDPAGGDTRFQCDVRVAGVSHVTTATALPVVAGSTRYSLAVATANGVVTCTVNGTSTTTTATFPTPATAHPAFYYANTRNAAAHTLTTYMMRGQLSGMGN